MVLTDSVRLFRFDKINQSIITQKWSQLIDCHRLALKNSRYATFQHVCICTRSTHECLRWFKFVQICSNLFVCSWMVSKIKNRNTLTDFEQFETVFWRNTSQQHTFSLSCSFRCPLYCWYLVDMNFQEFYIFTISYFSNRSCPHAVQDEIYYLIYPCRFLRIIKCSV